MKYLLSFMLIIIGFSCDSNHEEMSPQKQTPVEEFTIQGFWFVEEMRTDTYALITFAYPDINTSHGLGIGDFNYGLPEAKLYSLEFKGDNVEMTSVNVAYLFENKTKVNFKYDYDSLNKKFQFDSTIWLLKRIWKDQELDNDHILLKKKIKSLDDSIQYKLNRISN